MKIGVSHTITFEELLTEDGEYVLTESGEIIFISVRNNFPLRIPIRDACKGYYLRWWYNGWHYWFFLAGEINMVTEGQNYRTVGTRFVTMGSGHIDYFECQAIRTILNTREVYLFSDSGWANIRLVPGSVKIFGNQVDGYDIEITAVIGNKEISRTGYTPVEDIPETTDDPINITITHHAGTFTMTLTGIGDIVIDWGNGTPPETYTLTDVPLEITHTYTDGIDQHTIVIQNPEVITSLTADNQSITEITIPPTAVNLTVLILTNNELTDTPVIPDSVPLIVMDLDGNPLTTCEIHIGTQVWMCKNYDSMYPNFLCYNMLIENKETYGCLYNYNQIISEGFAPPGWHVPSIVEWEQLIDYLGATAGAILKEAGTDHWNAPNTGINTSNFTALGGGLGNPSGDVPG